METFAGQFSSYCKILFWLAIKYRKHQEVMNFNPKFIINLKSLLTNVLGDCKTK